MPGDSFQSEMPYRVLGRTGERVSAIGVGGWHLGLSHVDEALSVRTVTVTRSEPERRRDACSNGSPTSGPC